VPGQRVVIPLSAIEAADPCRPDNAQALFLSSPARVGDALVYEHFPDHVRRLARLDHGLILRWLAGKHLVPMTLAEANAAIEQALQVPTKREAKLYRGPLRKALRKQELYERPRRRLLPQT
jgi:hypothetical protein